MFSTRFDPDSEAEWAPLEAVALLARHDPTLPSFHEAEFMYMGAVERVHRRLRIHLYKHRDTRRHLNLDAAGKAYEYCGPVPGDSDDYLTGRYRLHASLADALERVQLWLFDGDSQFWRSFPPSDWPADHTGPPHLTLVPPREPA